MLLNFAPLLPIIIVLCFAAVRFWGTAIMSVLVWAMFEGVVRKWILPDYQAQILLIKDFVLVFAYVGYFISTHRHRSTGPKSGTLLLLICLEGMYCTFELVNPNSPSQLLSLFGLKNYLIYLPLAFIVPEIIKDSTSLRKLLISTCLVAIPISMFGLYQFSQPPSSWINQYVSHEEGVENVVSTFGEKEEGDFKYGRARTSSTFSYIGGFTTLLILVVPLSGAILLSSITKRRTTLLIILTLAASLGAAATTGSRTPFLIFAISSPLMIIISGWKGLLPFQAALRLTLGLVILGALTIGVFGNAFSALEYRASNADSAVMRILSPFTEMISAFESSPILGTGIGTNSNAALSIMGAQFAWWLDDNYYEMETARVLQEIGFIGFVLVYLPKIFAVILTFSYLRKSKSPLMIATHMTAFIFVVVHIFLFTVNNPTGGLIYWALLGVSIAAYRIERSEMGQRSNQENYMQQGYPLQNISLS